MTSVMTISLKTGRSSIKLVESATKIPGYVYSSSDEREILSMQQEMPISVGPPTLDEILPKERDLTIFLDLLKKFEDTADIIIEPGESHTIFAPINSAFRKLKKKPSEVDDLSEDPTDKLHLFTLGFIVPSVYTKLPDGGELKTLRNTTIKLKKNFNGTFKLNGKATTIKMLKAINGVVYKINEVLEEEE